MKHRILGDSQINISEIGLGCWQLGADWGEGISQDKGLEILEEAVNQNINFFDTADVYGDGKSERLIGEFLSHTDKQIVVATKFGRSGNVYPDHYSESALRKSIENSLDRLGRSNLDLLQLHCIPTVVLKEGAIFDWLRKMKAEGIIKSFGASVETVEEGLICLDQEGITSLQVIYNIFRQKITNELLPQAKAKNVGIIVRLPLASGLLSGKFSKSSAFSDKDHRNYNRNGEKFNVGETFAGLPFEKGIELTQRMEENYRPGHMSMIELALRWILDHEAVTTVIPGASRPEQVRQNAVASKLSPLTDQIHNNLKSFYEKEIIGYIRGGY